MKFWGQIAELVPQTASPAGLSAKIQFLPAEAPVVLTISSVIHVGHRSYLKTATEQPNLVKPVQVSPVLVST